MSEQQNDKVFIEMEGGVIQNVTATNPNIDVIVVDTDIEGVEAVDIETVKWNDREVEATIVVHTHSERDPDWEAAILGAIGARAAGKAS